VRPLYRPEPAPSEGVAACVTDCLRLANGRQYVGRRLRRLALEQLGLGGVLPPLQLGVGNGNGARPTGDPPQASDGKVSLRIGFSRIDEALEA
jgi:hypothetical protein